MPQPTIYYIRHGQTAWNAAGRFQGSQDIPLNDLGRAQAAHAGGILKDLMTRHGHAPNDFDFVSSPLGRARETARIIAGRLGLPVELDGRLKEMSWGTYDGMLRSDFDAAHPEMANATRWAFEVSDGEQYADVAARVGAWLADLPPEPSRRVIAVSHGISGQVLRALYADLDPDHAGQDGAPQDAIFRLSDGAIARIDCQPVS